MKNVSRVSGISMNVLHTINQLYSHQIIKMNIVLDTNSLIMSIAPRSPYRKVQNAFLRGDYNLCVSNEIIEEYSEVLSRNISPQVSEAIVYAILTRPNIIRKDPHYTFALIEADLTLKEGSTSLTKPLSCPKREDVTALRCSEPLRFMVGGPSKVFSILCGMGPHGDFKR